MSSVKMPFARNENNILVHIADVESGKKCNCVCPDCGSPLIASKGNQKQHHFKHAVFTECEGGLESTIHLAAKMVRSHPGRLVTLLADSNALNSF